jgi:hypothetical protein
MEVLALCIGVACNSRWFQTLCFISVPCSCGLRRHKTFLSLCPHPPEFGYENMRDRLGEISKTERVLRLRQQNELNQLAGLVPYAPVCGRAKHA